MTHRSLVRWAWVHKWSSLVCTLFMFLLCLTGLPLIFSHEIDHLTGNAMELPVMEQNAPRADLESVRRAAMTTHPGLKPLYFFAEEDEPDLWLVKLDIRVDTDEKLAEFVAVDGRTAAVLGTPVFNTGIMHILYRLHVDLFLDLTGKLFLGLMGFLLLIAIVSGVVLYAPFMKKLDFGQIRRGRSRRLFWLDQHNLLGIVTAMWLLVVGGTGVINTWADLILRAWQAEQVAALKHGEVQTLLPPATVTLRADDIGVDLAVQKVLSVFPEMQVATVAFPGTLLSTPDHFAVLLRGKTPLTSRLTQTVLVHPATGEILQARTAPWYVTLLQLSQPLHFGDYGGLPLKLLWAVLDILTMIVLGSGLYLWWIRHKKRAGLLYMEPLPGVSG